MGTHAAVVVQQQVSGKPGGGGKGRRRHDRPRSGNKVPQSRRGVFCCGIGVQAGAVETSHP